MAPSPIVFESSPGTTLVDQIIAFAQKPPHELNAPNSFVIRSNSSEALPFAYIRHLFHSAPQIQSLELSGVNLTPTDPQWDEDEDQKTAPALERLVTERLVIENIASFRHNPSYLSQFLDMFACITLLKFIPHGDPSLSPAEMFKLLNELPRRPIPVQTRTKLSVKELDLGYGGDIAEGYLDCAVALFVLTRRATCQRVSYKCFLHTRPFFQEFLRTCSGMETLRLDVSRCSALYNEAPSYRAEPFLPSLEDLPVGYKLGHLLIEGVYCPFRAARWYPQDLQWKYRTHIHKQFLLDVAAMIRSLGKVGKPDSRSCIHLALRIDTRDNILRGQNAVSVDPKAGAPRWGDVERAAAETFFRADLKPVWEYLANTFYYMFNIGNLSLDVISEDRWMFGIMNDRAKRLAMYGMLAPKPQRLGFNKTIRSLDAERAVVGDRPQEA